MRMTTQKRGGRGGNEEQETPFDMEITSRVRVKGFTLPSHNLSM